MSGYLNTFAITSIYMVIYLTPCKELLAQVQKGQTIFGEGANDLSGWSVSMPDTNTVAIGAIFNDGNGFNSGHVRIFIWNGTLWVQKGLDIDGEAFEDNSGYAVSMPNANTIAIGAIHNDGSWPDAGHSRIYTWNVNTWVQKGQDIDGESSADEFGTSVSMPDGNTVAIGAIKNDGNGSDAGHVRIYEWNGIAWTQKGMDIDGEMAGDWSGFSVSMPDANTVAIGAPQNDGTGFNAGHARIYSWNGSSWVQKGNDIDGEAAGDGSGWSVSMPDSNTIAIGALLNDGSWPDAGHVRIYIWNGNVWTQKGQDIDGEMAGDLSGAWVSMPDVNTVAIGAPYNNGNGYHAGQVRIYNWNGVSWAQIGLDIDGDSASNASGWAVSMPSANTVAIGSSFNNGNGLYSGNVRIFTSAVSNSSQNTITSPFSFYPNPTQGILLLDFRASYPYLIVSIYGEFGNELSRHSFCNTRHIHLQLPESPGLYFIVVNIDNKQFAYKIIKE